MKKLQKNFIVALMSTVAIAVFAAMTMSTSSAANTSTPTSLGIRTGVFMFYKDTGVQMNTYFGHSGNQSNSIDIGTYDADLAPIAAASSGDHRFTVSDMVGESFSIDVQSSALTASGASIPATEIKYTATTNRVGTGKALTATGTPNTALNSPVTFVARTNNSGISKYSQEIALTVAIPAAQAPENYTGMLTFTY